MTEHSELKLHCLAHGVIPEAWRFMVVVFTERSNPSVWCICTSAGLTISAHPISERCKGVAWRFLEINIMGLPPQVRWSSISGVPCRQRHSFGLSRNCTSTSLLDVKRSNNNMVLRTSPHIWQIMSRTLWYVSGIISKPSSVASDLRQCDAPREAAEANEWNV